MVKRCFICGAKQDDAGNCTNANCPRYVVSAQTETTTEKTETTTTN